MGCQCIMIYMKIMKSLLLFVFSEFLIFFISSCVSKPIQTQVVIEAEDPDHKTEPIRIDDTEDQNIVIIEEPESELQLEGDIPPELKEKKILLTFAGDIMAHTNVTRMSDFSLIYDDIRTITLNDDLTFVNIESPVHSQRPYENYPTFNVQPPFVDAAIDAGFDVFSLANNHTNDQGKAGIEQTLLYFESQKDKNVYFAGIKKEESESLSYDIFEKNGFTVLFLAISEFFNQYKNSEYIDYISTNKNTRELFKKEIISLRERNPCDMFIISVHCYESEYVLEVSQDRKNFYYELLDCGADIIWANHPHVLQEWELIADKNTGQLTKAVFYSVGNTISGQRYVYNFDNPAATREYTGDSMLFQIELIKTKDSKPHISNTNQYLITTHIDSNKNSLIKLLTKDFIEAQKSPYKEYYTKRLELLSKIQGNTVCR